MSDPRVHMSKKPAKSISTSQELNALMEARRALNPVNTGPGRIQAGMKSLLSISKATGHGGKLPFTIDDIPSNVKWVLDMVGINMSTLMGVRQFNHTVVDQAELAARQVAIKVHAGVFSEGDARRFTPAFENAELLTRKAFTPPKVNGAYELRVSPYAMDLFAFAPKFKFLFVVQFQFASGYSVDSKFQKDFAFLIKKSSRPNVKYNTEDVNYYNFRTKYTAKASFDEMSMTFYDDSKNNVDAFFSAYTRAMSPVLNYETHAQFFNAEQEGIVSNAGIGAAAIPALGGVPVTKGSSASTGALDNEHLTIIENIRIFQIYDYGRKVNIFNFFNPRITSLDLDDLDMTSSEINLLDIKFTYDSMYLEMDKTFDEAGITDLTSVGQFPINNNGGVDPKRDRKTFSDVFSPEPKVQRSVGSITLPPYNDYIATDLNYRMSSPQKPTTTPTGGFGNIKNGNIPVNTRNSNAKASTSYIDKLIASTIGKFGKG